MQQAKVYLFSGILMALLQGTYVRRIKPTKELKTIKIVTILSLFNFDFRCSQMLFIQS